MDKSKTSILKECQSNFIKGNLETVMKTLINEKLDSDRKMSYQLSRFNELKQDKNKGIRTEDYIDKQTNLIRDSINDYLIKLENKINGKAELKTNMPTKLKWLHLAGYLTLAITLGTIGYYIIRKIQYQKPVVEASTLPSFVNKSPEGVKSSCFKNPDLIKSEKATEILELGICLINDEKKESGLQQLFRVIELNPIMAEPYIEIYKVLKSQKTTTSSEFYLKKYDEGITLMEQIIKESNGDLLRKDDPAYLTLKSTRDQLFKHYCKIDPLFSSIFPCPK